MLTSVVPLQIMGTVAHRAPMLGFYDTLKQINPYRHDGGARGMLSQFALAQAASIAATAFSYPFTLLCTRVIVAAAAEPCGPARGAVQCARAVLRERGTVGLWRGFGAQIGLSISGGMFLVLYDVVKGAFVS